MSFLNHYDTPNLPVFLSDLLIMLKRDNFFVLKADNKESFLLGLF